MSENLPGTIHSKRVPTEYDVSRTRYGVVLSDDCSREYESFTLKSAFAKAERDQDPTDPIHHDPFPDPATVPVPKKRRSATLSESALCLIICRTHGKTSARFMDAIVSAARNARDKLQKD